MRMKVGIKPPPKNMVIVKIVTHKFLPGKFFFERGYALMIVTSMLRTVPMIVRYTVFAMVSKIFAAVIW